ncbi:MAG: ATP-dependent sacrificial sulfur transferase LarE [Candidatus Omnitrophota bacterium]
MNKSDKLRTILKGLKRVVIAYSGGLDSTFLLKTAVDTLGRQNVLAVTARSVTYPLSEYKEARRLAKKIGAKQITIYTKELNLKRFKSNPVNRCYYCKKELFKKLDGIRRKRGFNYILDGTNFDDLKDVRHGRKAARELGVRSPLLEARMTKDDIRKFSKRLKLSTWDKPSFACLASRIPFNSEIKKSDLKKIGESEAYLRRLGLKQVRVRLHKDIARIEVFKSDFGRALKLRDLIVRKLKSLGFTYITLDLCGYRTGSMHEAK